MQFMHEWLQKIFFTLCYITSLSISVFSRLCFISWSSPLRSLFNWLCEQLYLKVPNHIYVLKWYIFYCFIYFGYFECLYMHLIWQRQERVRSWIALSPRVWGSPFSMSFLVYSLKPPINYSCRICTILCMILKKRLFIEALCRPLFTKYAHFKPLFPFQNNA